MSAITKAVAWAVGVANDNTSGYDQTNRWGPDYDCSSLLISAWEYAGVPVKTSGASYTGNMVSVFKSCGFIDVTSQITLATGNGLKVGDVLWKSGHTEMVCETGKIVGASANENGQATGGKTGDQTGAEIRVRTYYNGPWTTVLRYQQATYSGWIARNGYLTEAEMQNNSRIIYRNLIKRGWTINAIAALLGNFEAESTINPGIWQNLNSGNMAGGYGLAQWTPATKVSTFASDWQSNHNRQLDLLQYHLEHPGEHWVKRSPYATWTITQFAASTIDPYVLACVFAWNYEGSAVVLWGTDAEKAELKEKRGNAAVKWFNYLSNLPQGGNIPIWLLFKLKERRDNFVHW